MAEPVTWWSAACMSAVRYSRLLREAELMGYSKARDNGLGIGLIGADQTTHTTAETAYADSVSNSCAPS